MKITYIYHSGFFVELQEHVLIFDYYKGKLPKWDGKKSILFFASHEHHDHFDMSIFDYNSQYEKIHYFLSADMKFSDKYLERNGVLPSVKERINYIGKNQSVGWEDIQIETLRSTDEGVAFLVNAEGKRIYHAGDLNWWHWEGEDASWNRQMEMDYKKEMAKIRGRHFDAAFVPLDVRLEEAYDWGLKEFLKNADADKVFPMHMWDHYEAVSKFKQSACGMNCADKIADIQYPGQEFEISEGEKLK